MFTTVTSLSAIVSLAISSAGAQPLPTSGIGLDGLVRPEPAYCHMEGDNRKAVITPVFDWSPELETQFTRIFQDIRFERDRSSNYNGISCYRADTRAEAEAMIQRLIAASSTVLVIGVKLLDDIAAQEVHRKAVAEETKKLGAARAAEAERFVSMREAAERARVRPTKRAGNCPLSATAKVTCE